jgi:hypothetical protein
LSFCAGLPEEEECSISALKHNKSNWEKFNEETSLKENEGEGEKANCQSIVAEGLLLLLRDTILVLPDSMSQQVRYYRKQFTSMPLNCVLDRF